MDKNRNEKERDIENGMKKNRGNLRMHSYVLCLGRVKCESERKIKVMGKGRKKN